MTLPEDGRAVGIGLVKLGVALVAVGLKDAARLGEMPMHVLLLPVRGEAVDRARWRCPCPRSWIADIGPYPSLLHPLAEATVLEGPVQHPDRGIIGVEKVAGHHIGLDPFNQRRQHLHGAPTPVDQRAIRNVGPHPGKDLVQAIQGKMVIELGHEDPGQERRARHAAGDRTAGRGRLNHVFATAAGLLQPRNLQDLQLRRDQVEHLAHVFANEPQIAPAIRAAAARLKLAPLARGGCRHAGATARLALIDIAGRRLRGRNRRVFVRRSGGAFGAGDEQVLKGKFQLLDLALDLLRGLADGLLLELRDAQSQRLDELVMRPDRRRHLRVFRLQGGDHRLQNSGIFGKDGRIAQHATTYHGRSRSTIKTSLFRWINHPTRAGGAPLSGRRQSMPSHNIASCAEVSRTAPELVFGQGKRPRSRIL